MSPEGSRALERARESKDPFAELSPSEGEEEEDEEVGLQI